MYTCKVCGRKFKSIKALEGRASISLILIDRLRLIPPVNTASKYGSSKYGNAAIYHGYLPGAIDHLTEVENAVPSKVG